VYSYVRFRWWNPVELNWLKDQFDERFIVKLKEYPRTEIELSLHKDTRNELIVTSDTLKGYLSSFRALLNQKIEKPFTKKDMELREIVLKIYPQERPTPFPWQYNNEPPFEKE
jgi:hypothetical protein